MKSEPSMDTLLERWEENRRDGREVSVEELAGGDAELAQELRRRIDQLQEMNWLDAETKQLGCPCPDVTEKDLQAFSVPRLLNNRYRIEHLIGTGGFGQVWRATDELLQRPVAVKVTQVNCIEEARKVAKLKHQGIVTVHDVGSQDEFCFIVFDLVEGTDLAEKLGAGPLPWREAVRLAIQVSEYLVFAHKSGLVHRDIKPANILLDREGTPVLADFGIAISVKDLANETATTVGTVAYMSPEQLLTGQVTGPATDIYSLGIVLFEMLAGSPPFVAANIWELRQKVLHAPLPLELFDGGIPQQLVRVLERALAKDANARFASMAEFTENLKKTLESEVASSS